MYKDFSLSKSNGYGRFSFWSLNFLIRGSFSRDRDWNRDRNWDRNRDLDRVRDKDREREEEVL